MGKTPGPDGIPVEFYKAYAEELVPHIHDMLSQSLASGTLPSSMSEAVIVLIPKPGWDPDLCSSYHLISLLNVDAKILAKILATRLNGVSSALTSADQSGFIPGKGTDISISRLYTHIAPATLDSWGVLAQKAFDSVEWTYL